MVFSEMPTSLAISDISILAPDSSRHFIILRSVSLRSVYVTDRSATEILTTVAEDDSCAVILINKFNVDPDEVDVFATDKVLKRIP